MDNYSISKIGYSQAKDFVEKWHYSGKMPSGKNFCYGLFCEQELYAVIVYGDGVNPYQARFLKVNRTTELKRLCRQEPRRDYQLSKMIRQTMRLLAEEQPFDAIVTFADPENGHSGTIYKATGFTHEGMTNAEWHLVDSSGNPRHRRIVQHTVRKLGIKAPQARELLGLRRIRTSPKFRWVLRVSSETLVIPSRKAA